MPRLEHAFESDLNPLSPHHHLIRVRFITEGNLNLAFMVQYETFMDGQWRTVVRYDTSHGEAHRDDYAPSGTQIHKHWLGVESPPFNDAYTAAINDIQRSWREYYRAFRAMERDRR